MDPAVLFGIICCFCGSIGNNLGNNIQSLGLQNAAKSDEVVVGYNKTWIIGTIIFVTGALLIFVSFAFAPASILAPIEAIQFVTNVTFGKFVLKRPVNRRMILGTVLIVVGTLLAVSSGSHKSQKLTVDDLTAYWAAPGWLAFVGCLVVIASVAWLVHQLYNFRMRRYDPLPWHEWIAPLTYALFSAIAGTQSVVQAKCMSELIEQWTSGAGNIWTHWFTYLCVVLWFVMVGVWLFQLNKALGIYDPIFMIPLLQANFILFAVLSGGVYFREFVDFKPLQWIGFFGGIGVMFIGLYLLAAASLALAKKEAQVAALDINTVPPDTTLTGKDHCWAGVDPSDVDAACPSPTSPSATCLGASGDKICLRATSTSRGSKEEKIKGSIEEKASSLATALGIQRSASKSLTDNRVT
jgi:drug/metabolite transporter (DMT)-like permease